MPKKALAPTPSCRNSAPLKNALTITTLSNPRARFTRNSSFHHIHAPRFKFRLRTRFLDLVICFLFSHSLGQKHPFLSPFCKPFVFCKNKYSSPLDCPRTLLVLSFLDLRLAQHRVFWAGYFFKSALIDLGKNTGFGRPFLNICILENKYSSPRLTTNTSALLALRI